jgi:hypothetical protein
MVLDGSVRLHIWKGPIQSSAMSFGWFRKITYLGRSSPVSCEGFEWFRKITYLERSNSTSCDGFGWFRKIRELVRSSPVSWMVLDGSLRIHIWQDPIHSVVMVLDGSVGLESWKGPIQPVVMVLDGSLGIREFERSSPVRCDGFGWFHQIKNFGWLWKGFVKLGDGGLGWFL